MEHQGVADGEASLVAFLLSRQVEGLVVEVGDLVVDMVLVLGACQILVSWVEVLEDLGVGALSYQEGLSYQVDMPCQGEELHGEYHPGALA